MTAMNLSPAPDGPSPEITLESALAELDELLEEIPIWTPEPGDQIEARRRFSRPAVQLAQR